MQIFKASKSRIIQFRSHQTARPHAHTDHSNITGHPPNLRKPYQINRKFKDSIEATQKQ